MQIIDELTWRTIRCFLWLFGKLYRVKISGLEHADVNKAAVFAVKHASNLDLPVMLHTLPRKPVTFASKGVFVNPVTNYLLRVSGVIPVYGPTQHDRAERLSPSAIQTGMIFYHALRDGSFVVYAPEGRRVLNSIGEVDARLVVKAAELGYNTYLVGIAYSNRRYPLLSLFSGMHGIEVTMQSYSARNKSSQQVKAEVEQVFARLSSIILCSSRLEQLVKS